MSANDNPRPWKKNVTGGEWEATNYGYEQNSVNGKYGQEICSVWKEANSLLLTEAGTVLHQTGMTPGELAERVRELKFELEDALEELKSLRFSRGL